MDKTEFARKESARLKREAIDALSKLFQINEGYSSGLVESIVSNIIEAAVLETSITMSQAIDFVANKK